jgi:flagellar hook-basal body complex protein FliE
MLGSNFDALSSIPTNTNQGLLGMGQHLHQTQGYLDTQPIQVYRMPEQPLSNNFQYMEDSAGGVNNFRNVMLQMVSGVNETTSKPDELMREALAGGPADIQDVMMATTKAELAVSLTSQMLTKVIQAYEKLSQVQI